MLSFISSTPYFDRGDDLIRRVHVHQIRPGTNALDPAEAHHIRDVLRMETGTSLELFDDAGQTATGTITLVSFANVVVDVETIASPALPAATAIVVAAAIPKGDRAEWMIEKLAELGVTRFIPLATQRSVVLPSGKNKIERWERIAIESAKQSRRASIMAINQLTPLAEAIKSENLGWYLSTSARAKPIATAISSRPAISEHTLLIGPEGGWSPDEMAMMERTGLQEVGLTSTVLRVETAAVAAAAIAICCGGQGNSLAVQ